MLTYTTPLLVLFGLCGGEGPVFLIIPIQTLSYYEIFWLRHDMFDLAGKKRREEVGTTEILDVRLEQVELHNAGGNNGAGGDGSWEEVGGRHPRQAGPQIPHLFSYFHVSLLGPRRPL